MLFNSIEYIIFLLIVFLLYWFVFDFAIAKWRHQLVAQNMLIVIASYIFYGWWNWRFLGLIAFISICSWGSGLLIGSNIAEVQDSEGETEPSSYQFDKAKAWLIVNIAVNLTILGVFKYYDFFVTSFAQMLGANPNGLLLQIILPVGISFYTFQALSYCIDIYRGKIEPTKDIVAFFAYISFFPQLVAGPIERATNLLPQFQQKRIFEYASGVEGMRQILWGVFKKMVVADNCARYVDLIWADYSSQSASTLILASILFSFQIYGDFSGYSDIAIGTSKLFGIKLMDNFKEPYFSRNIAEFWKRWHISLNTWFVNYVYIPLGGSRRSKWHTIRNTTVIFLLSGLWHGANWTYIGWGVYHALLFIPLIWLDRTKVYQSEVTRKQIPQVCMTFAIVTLGWIIFRAPSIEDAWMYITKLFDKSIVNIPYLINRRYYIPIIISIAVLFTHERYLHHWNFTLRTLHANVVYRWTIYLFLLIWIYFFGSFNYTQFIYFQF